MLLGKLLQQAEAAVLAAVVDVQDLVRSAQGNEHSLELSV
jgi:hypothetical protein